MLELHPVCFKSKARLFKAVLKVLKERLRGPSVRSQLQRDLNAGGCRGGGAAEEGELVGEAEGRGWPAL